jgi:hypothetical protein
MMRKLAAMPLSRAFLSALLCIAVMTAAVAQPEPDAVAAQQRIEAAYLFKFGSYITWPDNSFAGADSPFVIGVAGSDTLADELTTLVASRQVDGRTVQVRHLHAGQSVAGVHLLFVAADTPQGQSLIDAARSNYTVCVTEGSDGLERGADISFVLVNDRVRFDISLDTTQASGVKVSSQLLTVADKITGDLKP